MVLFRDMIVRLFPVTVRTDGVTVLTPVRVLIAGTRLQWDLKTSTFDRYEEGVVYLYLQGSCSGCPSSTATLKQGIETRLREAIPGIKDVVAI